MNEVNYNETVILPYLQRKYQEAANSNLVLEATLLVEQAKNRDLLEKLQKMTELQVASPKKKKSAESVLDANTY